MSKFDLLAATKTPRLLLYIDLEKEAEAETTQPNSHTIINITKVIDETSQQPSCFNTMLYVNAATYCTKI